MLYNCVQSYGKTSEMQKENLFFFHFRVSGCLRQDVSFSEAKNFGKAKVTKKACKSEAILGD
jgi:hypothetical protein